MTRGGVTKIGCIAGYARSHVLMVLIIFGTWQAGGANCDGNAPHRDCFGPGPFLTYPHCEPFLLIRLCMDMFGGWRALLIHVASKPRTCTHAPTFRAYAMTCATTHLMPVAEAAAGQLHSTKVAI